MQILGIHHLTVAVRDIETARATFAKLLGASPGPIDIVPAFGVRTSELALGDGALQIAAPIDADSPVMRFIERKGEGFYTVAFEVDDLDAAVAELAAQGMRVSEPVAASPGMRSAFVATSATHGLSIQLVEVTGASDASPAQPLQAAEPREPAPAPAPAPTPQHPLDLSPDD